ncbi:uncharacterized protein LOC144863240 isoform X2 [Branchiostoma floridae x Branchiostoma japonicum]
MRLGQVVQSSCLTPCDVCPGTVSPAVRTCIGCELSYCKGCLERTHGNDGLGHCLVKPDDHVESEMPRCRQHGQLVELFCQTDGVPVCLECLQTGRHKGHSATSMEDWANDEQKRHDARAVRKRARHESDSAVGDEIDDSTNTIGSVNEVLTYAPSGHPRDRVHVLSTGKVQASVPPESNRVLDTNRSVLSDRSVPNVRPVPNDRSVPNNRPVPKERPVFKDRPVSNDRPMLNDNPVPRDRHEPNDRPVSIDRPAPDDISTVIRARDHLPREGRLVGWKYNPSRGEVPVDHTRTAGETVQPIVGSFREATTHETAKQHVGRERQQPARGCLSTGQVLTHPIGGVKQVVNPPVHNRFDNATYDRFYQPQEKRIVEASSSVSASSGGPYYISCREEVVGPVEFSKVEPSSLEDAVADYLQQKHAIEQDPTIRGCHQDTDQRPSGVDSVYVSHARLVLNNIKSSQNVGTGAEHSLKHPKNEEQRFTTRHQTTGESLVDKEAGFSPDTTPKPLELFEHRRVSISRGLKLPEEDLSTRGNFAPTERQQQGYRPRSREQANKDVQQAVQDMFTKYMVTGHGLATTGQHQLSPDHSSSSGTIATNNKRSQAIFRPARKLLGMNADTKATRIARAVNLANKPDLGLKSESFEEGRPVPQHKTTSGLGVQSWTATKDFSARSTQEVPGTLNTALGQKYALKANTTEEDMQTSQSQNKVRSHTGGGKPIGTEPHSEGQCSSTQQDANSATLTSSKVASGEQNRLGDSSGTHVRVNTHTSGVSPAGSQLPKSEDQSKVLEKTEGMGQEMNAGPFKAGLRLRLSGRRGKPSSRDVPTRPMSVNMAMSLQDTASAKPKRQDHRNGGVTSTGRTDRRQQAKTDSTAARRGSDSSLAVRIARVLPQRRETSDGSQQDIAAQSSLPRIIPTLCGVGHTWITLRWTVSEVENYKAYQVQYQKHGGPVNVTPFRYGSTRETVDNLSPGTTYTMQVRALDMEGLVHCSSKVDMKTSSRRLAVPPQETAAKLRQAVQQARQNKEQDAKSKKTSRWGISHLTSSFRRKKKKSATSESDTESKASYTESPTSGRRESNVRRSSIDSQDSEISTMSTISRTSRKSQKRVHFKEEDISKAYDIREMQALYPELSKEEKVIGDNVLLPESTKQVDERDHHTNDERKAGAESKQQADIQRRQQVSSPVFMSLMDQGEESEAETFKRVADNVRGTLGMSIKKVSVEVQTQEGGIFRPVVRAPTVRGSGEDIVSSKPSDRSASSPEWDTNVDSNIAQTSPGFRNVKRERTWQEIIEEDYDPKEGWKNVQVGDKMRFIDLEAIKPYRKVLTHAGYYGDKSNAIVVFSSCYMPNNSLKDYEYIMENLFLYILSFLDKVVDEEYKIVFLNYTKERSNLPSVTWLKSCYDHIDAKFKKKLKGLFIVHPTMWLKMLVHVSKPFVSSKFSKKLQFVDNFKDLQKQLPVDPEAIPEDVKKFEEELVGSTSNKRGTFAALKAALGREVQQGSVPENAFCAPYNKGLASSMWEGFPTLRL